MIPIARPKLLTDGKRAFMLLRDKERGSKISLATAADITTPKWEICDLTDFSVDAWEPSVDASLWQTRRLISVFCQETHQGDGEKALKVPPTPVKVITFKP